MMKRKQMPVLCVCISLLFPLSAFAKTEMEQLKEQLQSLTQRLQELENKQQSPGQWQNQVFEERLSDVETAVVNLNKTTRLEEALDGVSVGGSLVVVGQSVTSGGTQPNVNKGQLNYRGDLEIEVPLGDFGFDGPLGNASSKLYTQVRFGQGQGAQPASGTFTGAVNSTAFQQAGAAEDATALIAQAWYQLDVPVGRSGKLDMLELTVGKIDPFVFFDSNELADNETERFLNNVFVHNPLLDSGGDMGVDAYGFTPGIRSAYTWDANNTNRWTASLGLFGAGNGATFNNSLTDPFAIVQLQYNGRALLGKSANYQAYYWRNPQAVNVLDGLTEVHEGVGLSASQAISKSLSVFSRLGWNTQGNVAFDKAFAVGMALSGRVWRRNADHIGLAWAQLHASDEYENAGLGSGYETNAELYYAWRLNDHLQFAPNLQYIRKPAGLENAQNITVLGLRTTAAF